VDSVAEICFVTPASASQSPTEPPSALLLLNHTVRSVVGGDQAAAQAIGTDLGIVDARSDLGAARATCQLIATATDRWPILLLVPAAGLSAVGTDWRIDDFILDDASPAEFEARIRCCMQGTTSSNTLVAGPIAIDEDAYLATMDGEPLDLTYTEFELLKYMVAHPGRVLTRELLLSEVWGYDYFGGTRTVDVHIRRLRAKLGPEHDQCIGTVRNVGYRFSASR